MLDQWVYIMVVVDRGPKFHGIIDEVRVANRTRSDEWIMAQYLSMTENFITYGEPDYGTLTTN